ncbi:Uncharacterised protein [Chryseobacterium nakagawai]|uniref:PBCV-specific basic adaptor domain-containing protein n=1 Tax=Chryseobacterium nakagawai TaxID=1241982 RepID=A0AAD0YJ68_CHRNA|nr:hypothetical protein [Chryseobacterium nakagawai]AZA91571.1 hypothetical protein EG343_13530 [Chryseobacterium nakagawai]VEH18051.1 Uncharacterised protein [Chryseobacterium nakagawai]
MKKLFFTGLLGLGLLLPVNFSASTLNITSAKELLSKNPRKGKTKSSRKSKSPRSSYSSTRSYLSSKSRGCTYSGNQLYVGKKGGCYYYSGNSKKYVNRSYCAGCN